MSDELNRAAPIVAQLDQDAERAALEAFPNLNSPHTSVNMRTEADRAAYRAGFLAARRADSVAAQLDAELPPLPPATEGTVTGARRWSASRMWEYADQARAPYAERIRLLEHKVWCAEVNLDGAKEHLAELERERAAPVWAAYADNGNVIIWSRNRAEVEPVAAKYGKPVVPVIAYIDGRTAGTALPAHLREFVEAVGGPCFNYTDRETDQTCCSGCNQPEKFVSLGEGFQEQHADNCIVLRARTVLAAAPSPQENTK